MPIYTLYKEGYDEVYQVEGQLTGYWEGLLQNLSSLGIENLSQRYNKAQRILRNDGVTYKPYDESKNRSWKLDPVPLVLDSQTWESIESGLLQRAELFDVLLKDIYGRQELIRQGVIPPEAVFSNPGFLRPCFGSVAIAEQGLLLCAVDMLRTPDHHVTIIGDRTQSPSGAGNALENRTVINRVFPSLFRDTQVRRLTVFFQSMRHRLNQLSPTGELPNIVVLTPGSRSESYFEHAYLANYLGYSLVQGRDLTVRNGRVWTKSLGGLTRVDVILRRVDDFFCDPAELKSDSYLGVPGLLEVVRSKKVAVANPIGSAALESAVYLKYIDNISQFFTGKTLSLPTAKTYWAYDKQDMEFILDNIHRLVIKPSFKSRDTYSVLGHRLKSKQLDELRKKILANPLRIVAQEFITPGFSPTWEDNQLVPRPSVLRSFAVVGDSFYTVMPGGLTCTGQSDDASIINHHIAGLSKDTWVLTEEPEQQFSPASDKHDVAHLIQEQLPTLPSRVVENMFWLGRYAVRAEFALRLLRTVFLQLNHSQQFSEEGKKTLLIAVTKVTETFPGFTQSDSVLLSNPETELMSVILDEKRAGSLMYSLNELLECAEEVKPLMSADTQRVVNDIRDEVKVLGNALKYDFASAPEEALDPLVTSLLTFSGLVHESMIRGYGWRFIEIGRNLERSYQTMLLIRALITPVQKEFDKDIILETLLLTLEALITYRRRFRARTDVVSGLVLTIMDDSNPRSLHYLLQELQKHIEKLPVPNAGPLLTPERRTIIGLLHKIQLSDLHGLCVPNKENQRNKLDELMEQSQDLINELSGLLSDRYFDHMESYQQIQKKQWEEEL
ncbi:hypothetical protein AB835_06895 [Candidatus Endobugula sertula]|uniref:Uncharacterized protein n=1 Tax=Candidatus Endobugula sertula TaxID=62101 RepID=A0A1D2QQF0_9GAMM|nr:hypothetical protein AB835_06895 [Candidatus Endobugula sertula]